MLRRALTCQHSPPEVLSRGQPWTPAKSVGGLASGGAPQTHAGASIGCWPLTRPSASGSSPHPRPPSPACLPWAGRGLSLGQKRFSRLCSIQLP